MEAECVVEENGNCWMSGFTPNEHPLTAFHSSPVSCFLSIAQNGFRNSVAEEGGQVCKEHSGVYSAPSIWLNWHYVLKQSETTTEGRNHVLVYEILVDNAATKRKKKKGRVKQYVTPTESVMPLFLYYMVYDRPKL